MGARRRLARWGAAFALAVTLTACDGAALEPSPAVMDTARPTPTITPQLGAQGTLRFAIQEPAAIIPAYATEPNSLQVVDALFDSLTGWDAEGNPVPAAAVAWEPDGEAQVWTFSLREEAIFHDGTPVRAQDFVSGWSVVAQADRVGYLLRDVEGYEAVRDGSTDRLAGLEAVDDHTLTVRLTRPRGDFPMLAGHPALAPLLERAVRADPEQFEVRPIGNGPFQAVEEWARGQFVRVGRFPDWKNGSLPARVDEVLFQVLDADAAYIALQQGRVHVATIPAGALSSAIERFGFAVDGTGPGVHASDAPALYFLGFNPAVPPFDDLAVRQAVSLAIDRARLAAETLEGNARPASGLVPPGLDEAVYECAACRHDPAAARAVFEERGIFELALWFNRGGGHERVAELLRQDLAEAGVRLVYRTAEFPDFLATVRNGEAGFYRFGWQADFPSVVDAVEPLVGSRATPDAGGYNFARYTRAAVDEALAAAAGALDPAIRREAVREVERMALDEDQIIVPLITLRYRTAVRSEVTGLRFGPTGLARLELARLEPPAGDPQ